MTKHELVERIVHDITRTLDITPEPSNHFYELSSTWNKLPSNTQNKIMIHLESLIDARLSTSLDYAEK